MLQEYTDTSDKSIDAVWRTEEMDSWYVTFRTKDQALQLAALADLSIGNTKVAQMCMQYQRVLIKVHWLPYGYKPSLLKKAFSNFGQLEDVDEVGYTGITG